MAQVINTNIPSLNAQRNLERSGTSLATALQRLSSGLRINSAKDDAAGLAISERFTTQIRGLNVAVRNANDGISLSQTAEGALGEIGANLQRIRELAVQARNATNSASDRAALDAEVQQRLAEIDRTAAQTSFNGQKILDGSFGNATFQVGANAGETIGLTLDSSMRLASLGSIASATSGVLGGPGAGGTLAIPTGATENYSAVGSPATNGTLTLTPATRNFGTTTTMPQVDGSNAFNPGTLTFGDPVVAGTSTPFNPSTLNFGTPAAPQVDGSNTQGSVGTPITQFDFSGAALSQFDIDGIGITLTANYTDVNGVAAAIQTQLQAVDPTYTVTNAAGVLTIEKAGSLAPVVVSNADANAVAANFANSAGTAGSPAVATTNASFQVDGFTVNLNQNYASDALLAADIQTQLSPFYTAADDGSGNISITRVNNPSAVVISTPDANASAAGITASAGTAGTPAMPAQFDVDGTTVTLNSTAYADETALAAHIQSQLTGYTVTGVVGGNVTISRNGDINPVVISNANAQAIADGIGNSAGTAGSVATSATVATFDVDGTTVTLNQNYASFDDVATAIATQLGAGFDVVNTSGSISITRTDAPGSTSTAINITNASAYSGTVGLGNQTGTAGQDLVPGSDVAFNVDGTPVTLNGNYATRADLAAAIQSQLTGYTVTATGTGILITNPSAGSTAPVVTAGAGQAGTNATSEGFLAGVGTNGTPTSIVLAPGAFTITAPPAAAVDLAGTYASPQDFAKAINDNVAGVYASINPNGSMSLRSSRDFSIGGTQANALLGFTGTTFPATTGNLSTVNVLTPEGADEVILRVDAALTSVSGLRSNFGAIQNRFESTIANLQTTSENLSASRSRILDADFAQETAELTRAQILQQAGTAILAQANQLPQNVLSLLQ